MTRINGIDGTGIEFNVYVAPDPVGISVPQTAVDTTVGVVTGGTSGPITQLNEMSVLDPIGRTGVATIVWPLGQSAAVGISAFV